jgi:SAM-dependent methyltransferase
MTRASLDDFVRLSPIARAPIAAAVTAFAASLAAQSKVLDAGAGTAPYRDLFSHCEYHTHDWAESPHEEAGHADILGDLLNLPVAADEYDAVLLTEVLEHVANPHAALTQLHRVLRTGGRILVTVPFVGELHEEPYDFYRYTSHGLQHLLTEAGFGDTTVWPLTGWFGTLAHVLRIQAQSTCEPAGRRRLRQRLVGAGFLVMSQLLYALAEPLDRFFDTRRAMPVGWAASSTKLRRGQTDDSW